MKHFFLLRLVFSFTFVVSSIAYASHRNFENRSNEIKREILEIEIEAMFHTFKELATDIQSLKLEQLHLMVREKTTTDEDERISLEHKLRTNHLTLHLMRELSEETRKSLEHHAEEIQEEDHDGHHEMDEEHGSWTNEMREKLHHLEREIEELHDSGEHEHARKMERYAEEIRQRLHHPEARHHEEEEDHDGHHEMDKEHGSWTDNEL